MCRKKFVFGFGASGLNLKAVSHTERRNAAK